MLVELLPSNVAWSDMQIFIYCKATLHVSGVTAPSSGVLKTVTAASGTCHTTCTATPLQHGLIGTGLCESLRVVLQWINICILLHVLDFYSHYIFLNIILFVGVASSIFRDVPSNTGFLHCTSLTLMLNPSLFIIHYILVTVGRVAQTV